MAAFLDLCRFIPTAGGTTDWTFSSAVGGCQSPSAANAVNGRAYKFLAVSADLTQWEICEGVYSSAGAGSFARTTVIYNSSGSGTKSPGQSGAGTKINFTATPQVAVIGIKEDLISIEEANAFTSAQAQQALSNIGGAWGGTVNKFRNSAVDIWQRGKTPALTASMNNTGAYTADGWIIGHTATVAAAPAVAAQAGRGLTVNALAIAGATNLTDVFVRQNIESYVAAALASQQVTVQAQVFNNTGASITPTLTVKHPTSTQDDFTTLTADVSAVNLQACANSAWTLVAYTFACPAGAVNGLQVTFDFGNNFSANTKSVKFAEADIRVTPGVATGLNSAPPQPELRPIFAELPFNQRYFNTSYDLNVAPGSLAAGSAPNTNGVILGISPGNLNRIFWNVPFPVKMRVAPTVTVYSARVANTTGVASDLTNSADVSISVAYVGATAAFIQYSASGVGAVTDQVALHYTAQSELL